MSMPAKDLKKDNPAIVNKTPEELEKLLEQVRQSNFSDEDKKLLIGCVEFSSWMPQKLQEKRITIDNLRRTLFGEGTSKKKKRKKKKNNKGGKGNKGSADDADSSHKADEKNLASPSSSDSAQNKQDGTNIIDLKSYPKKKGHGRLGHQDYTNAYEVWIEVEKYQVGDPCPWSCGGKLYALKTPGIVVHIAGQSFAEVTTYKLERLRCATCQVIIKAQLPTGIGATGKYDATFKAQLSVQKYYVGMPFYRQEDLQQMLDFPLPSSTQFELCEGVANCGYPVLGALEKLAANGKLAHNDDTSAKILSVIKDNDDNPNKKRTGMFTTGILSKLDDGHRIYLFYTGTQHAGENLEDLLQARDPSKEKIIQMCDALSANLPKKLKTIVCNCLSHALRQFRDLVDYYPDSCSHILHELGKVYSHDEETEGMSDNERLVYHRKHSKPIMLSLHQWLKEQLATKQIEPNSPLGKAVKYMLKHWKKLRRFLTTPGAPLDNNVLEQALKIPIRLRKTAMFYKTEHGAAIGSILISLIMTAKHCGENPVEYLAALQENKSAVFSDPAAWVPWCYRETLALLSIAQAA
ncbi:hypothetical protein MNBD_GAMMA12-258 [hydrothermal vent metagenome]|uniref:Transposase IS66 central domain-containing protein n=2 Tax=hydrothermal vent metagenome TaxID=652676 RepID=A0A3B0Z5M6_9ZZZZ